MALSRRLFLGGLLTVAAAPAIVTSKGFRASLCEPLGRLVPVQVDFQTNTGRISSSEPAWQDFKRYSTLHPDHRDAFKRMLFCQRYGTPGPLKLDRFKPPSKSLVLMDFSDMEQRVLAMHPLNMVVS